MTLPDIVERIEALKRERNAVLLVHNYQNPEVQDIADFAGDSLGLSRQAAKTDADVIVFCGVHFMAETAAIISPDKLVIMPDQHAGCPMADMITADQLRELKKEHPQAAVICYVNSTAEVKAESDICCTSSNAVKVVASVEPDREIIFVPDQYLGTYAASQTGRKLILWPGYCPTHVGIRPDMVEEAKRAHPEALLLVHPECPPSITELADGVLSTGGMIDFVKSSAAEEFLIGTETGMIHALKKQNPDKRFYPVHERAVCPNMKLITLEKVLWSLEDLKYEISVPKDIADRARAAIERMLAL